MAADNNFLNGVAGSPFEELNFEKFKILYLIPHEAQSSPPGPLKG